MRQTMRPRKPREWANLMGSVCGDIEEDGLALLMWAMREEGR